MHGKWLNDDGYNVDADDVMNAGTGLASDDEDDDDADAKPMTKAGI